MTRAVIAPVIETERLRLRPYHHDDFKAYLAIMQKPEVLTHLGALAGNRSQLWEKFLRGPAFWPVLGYGFWIAERKSDGRQLGHLGFADFKRIIEPSLPDVPEMGWIFDSDIHGQGYASEALGAALDWGDRELGSSFCCIISPANTPSIKLAERHGFKASGSAMFQDAAISVFERPANP